jgi:hypothetical protein
MPEFADARSYLLDLHEMVGPSYTDLANGGPYKCYPAAISIAAHMLLADEKSTYIDHLCRDDRQPIALVPFEPAERWLRHFVCVDPHPLGTETTEPLVYDPIFPEPLPYNDFLAALFRNPEEIILRERWRYGPAEL